MPSCVDTQSATLAMDPAPVVVDTQSDTIPMDAFPAQISGDSSGGSGGGSGMLGAFDLSLSKWQSLQHDGLTPFKDEEHQNRLEVEILKEPVTLSQDFSTMVPLLV